MPPQFVDLSVHPPTLKGLFGCVPLGGGGVGRKAPPPPLPPFPHKAGLLSSKALLLSLVFARAGGAHWETRF